MKKLSTSVLFLCMGLIKYSPLVTTMSGKLSGGKLYKGRSGNIISTKVKPINRRTPNQLAVRDSLRYWASEWKIITPVNRLLWAAHAENFTKKNRVGDSHVISAFNYFVLEQQRNTYAFGGVIQSILFPTIDVPALNGNIANPAITVRSAKLDIDTPLISQLVMFLLFLQLEVFLLVVALRKECFVLLLYCLQQLPHSL